MWFVYSQVSAVFEALKDILAKKSTKVFDSPVIISWSWVTFSLIVLVPLAIWSGIPEIKGMFWLALGIRTVLDLLGVFFYGKSIKNTDISLAIPMMTFTPLVAMISSIPINSELPSIVSGVGILIIMFGVYLLGITKTKSEDDILLPFKNLIKDKGVLYMFFTAVFFGINASLHKLSINNLDNTTNEYSDILFSTALGYVFLSILLIPIMIKIAKKSDFQKLKSVDILKNLVPLGMMGGMSLVIRMYALSIAATAYVSASVRTSIIFSTILGSIFFKENIKERIFPILIMILGVILIVLGS